MSYNIFNDAHLPLKLALISGCTFLDKSPGTSIIAAVKCVGKIEEILKVFKNQIQLETSQILPLIFEYEPSIWALYTSGHHKANNLCRGMESLIQDFKQSESTSEKLEIIEVLKNDYSQFVLYNFQHMDDEEAVVNEILWRYYKDPVILQIAESINSEGKFKQQQATVGQELATAA